MKIYVVYVLYYYGVFEWQDLVDLVDLVKISEKYIVNEDLCIEFFFGGGGGVTPRLRKSNKVLVTKLPTMGQKCWKKRGGMPLGPGLSMDTSASGVYALPLA